MKIYFYIYAFYIKRVITPINRTLSIEHFKIDLLQTQKNHRISKKKQYIELINYKYQAIYNLYFTISLKFLHKNLKNS